MKKLFYISIVSLIVTSASAQQQYQHSQYQTNPYMLNPAASGIYEYLDISAGYRQQWVGFNNAPKTFFVSGHSALGNGNKPLYNPSLRIGGHRGPVKTPEIRTGRVKHAVGGFVYGDEYGAFKQLSAMGSYAIHIPVTRGYNLSFGVAAGYSQYTFMQNKAEVLVNGDPTYDGFLAAGTNQGYINANAGLWFYSKDLFVGYSSAQLLQTLVNIGTPHTDFDLSMHHYITAGYKIKINQDLDILPSALFKFMAPAPLSMDYTIQAIYKEWMWGGISYRHQDAIIGIFGMNINELFKIGYSYDFTLSKLKSYNQGSHEIILGVTLGR